MIFIIQIFTISPDIYKLKKNFIQASSESLSGLFSCFYSSHSPLYSSDNCKTALRRIPNKI
ncbi:hypothetical protein BACSTE_02829 [Bacteroides stercoris ATCC 43183]|uniref:Uncharacterized protein n=1 Tax=Bacteroides stercoris ATCC 43183 TaxID=449673 RepID=B0NTK0_BACSE|nr:hypothetical protein BACSTE_02829 [Bacteroides stercoris ATCC 43183]